MFKYVSDVSELSHNIINRFVLNKEVAIDATLGNGYDTDFLGSCFEKVYSFEIQKDACENYIEKIREDKNNIIVINDSHHKLKDYVNESVDCIIYNLGYLPGSDKSITTKVDTTMISIKQGLDMLKSGGLCLIAIYRGHEEGKCEEHEIYSYVSKLTKNKFGVMEHKVINRSKSAPVLLVIEKK